MKKLLCTMTASMIAVSVLLSGCGSKSETQPSATKAPEKPKEVKISLWYTANEADPNDRDHTWQVENIDAFMQANPNIKVEKTVIGGAGGENYRTKLSAEAASGNAPDVYMTWFGGDLKPLVSMGAAMPLNDIVEKDAALKEVINVENQSTAAFDGKIYALNDVADLTGLFYNKELFTKYSLTPPKTIDELIAVSKKFRENGIIPVAMGNNVKWTPGIGHIAIYADMVGYEAYKKNIETTNLDLSHKEFKDTMKKFNELVKAKIFSDNFNGVAPAEARATFETGKAAMFLQGTWNLGSIQKALGEKAGFIPFPGVNAKETYIVKSINKGYAINGKTKEKDAAVSFFKLMFSKDRQVALAYKGALLSTKNIPVDTSKTGPLYSDIMKLTNAPHRTIQQASVFANKAVKPELELSYQLATAENADVDAIFEKLQKFNLQNK